MTKAGTAAMLSFFIPGAGQLYNGDFLRALFWFVVASVFYSAFFLLAGPLSLAGVVAHAIPAYTAHQRALELHGRA
jgi:TM2 domain-containing membrane protein YozV